MAPKSLADLLIVDDAAFSLSSKNAVYKVLSFLSGGLTESGRLNELEQRRAWRASRDVQEGAVKRPVPSRRTVHRASGLMCTDCLATVERIDQ